MLAKSRSLPAAPLSPSSCPSNQISAYAELFQPSLSSIRALEYSPLWHIIEQMTDIRVVIDDQDWHDTL
jgi:hypothetical protein